jgi:diguanylate cyclase (GGDEF)-like protein
MTDQTAVPVTVTHGVIESIIELTEQREQRSLEQSLIGSLREMLEGMHGWALEIDGNAASAPQFDAGGHPTPLPPAVLSEAGQLSSGSPPVQMAYEGRHYLLVLLLDAGEGRKRVLALARDSWRQADLQLVTGMLRVYQNFIRLLFDSEKDTLTGLYNRRKLEAKLSELLASHIRGRRGTDQQNRDFLAILDLDRFKRINDTYGHLIGDEVLLIFSNLLRQTLRDSDLIFRYGGEEFIVILQDAPATMIHEVLDRVRQRVAEHAFPQVGEVTVSIGYAVIGGHQLPPEIIAEADLALYYAKEHGRNRVCEYAQLVQAEKIAPVGRHDGSIELF